MDVSVREIIEASNVLIEDGKNSEYMDVQVHAKHLQDRCQKLQEVFDNDPSDERSVRCEKMLTEDAYIKLEYYLNARYRTYADTVKLRKFATVLYDDCRKIFLRLSSQENVDALVIDEWSTRVRWALSFLDRSRHVKFVCTNEDEIQIRALTIEISKYKED